jgi:uncharacterized protein YjbJ (UPF0337 family)
MFRITPAKDVDEQIELGVPVVAVSKAADPLVHGVVLSDSVTITSKRRGCRARLGDLSHGGRDMSGEQDQVVGKAKEFQGKVTGDKDRESEGKAQHAAGKIEHAVGDAADKVKGAADAVKDKADGR